MTTLAGRISCMISSVILAIFAIRGMHISSLDGFLLLGLLSVVDFTADISR
jgi:hypothetical protein